MLWRRLVLNGACSGLQSTLDTLLHRSCSNVWWKRPAGQGNTDGSATGPGLMPFDTVRQPGLSSSNTVVQEIRGSTLLLFFMIWLKRCKT